MLDTTRLLERAKAVLHTEADALSALAEHITPAFEDAARLLLECRGRAITTGVGKAGAIARKVAATLASTGCPAMFLHPADGVHGDLGAVTGDDVVIAMSYSGESDEVSRVLPTIGRIGAALIAITGRPASTLGKAATVVLDVGPCVEACPLGLAPTTSAVSMLGMGDALAISIMEARGFTRENFALYHPAGALGRRLSLRTSDVMRTGAQVACVGLQATVRDALFAITKAGAGCAFVLTDDGRLAGLLTDGDIRRALVKMPTALDTPASQWMNTQPIVISGDVLATEALAQLEESDRRPGEAPVLDEDGRPVGCIMLKDLLRSGIV